MEMKPCVVERLLIVKCGHEFILADDNKRG